MTTLSDDNNKKINNFTNLTCRMFLYCFPTNPFNMRISNYRDRISFDIYVLYVAVEVQLALYK